MARSDLQLNGGINRAHHVTIRGPARAFPDRGLMEVTHMQTAAVLAADRPGHTMVAHDEFLHSFCHSTQNLCRIGCGDLCRLDVDHADRSQVRVANVVDELFPTSR